jgi:hypothetical protein
MTLSVEMMRGVSSQLSERCVSLPVGVVVSSPVETGVDGNVASSLKSDKASLLTSDTRS